jgi:hypothetical protein
VLLVTAQNQEQAGCKDDTKSEYNCFVVNGKFGSENSIVWLQSKEVEFKLYGCTSCVQLKRRVGTQGVKVVGISWIA